MRRKQLTYNYWLHASQEEKHPAFPAFSENKRKYGGISLVKMQRSAGWVAAEELEHTAGLTRALEEIKHINL